MHRAVLLCVLGLLAPATASAAPNFGAVQTVPGTQAAHHQFTLGVAGDGTTLLATVMGSGLQRQVAVAERPPGGAWGEPEILDTGLEQGFQVAPLLAVNDAGAAVVVWRSDPEGYKASVRSAATGAWSGPEPIATTASEDGRAAIAPNGDIIVAWSREVSLPSPGEDSVRVVSRPAGGEWSDPGGSIVEIRDYEPGTFRVYDTAFTAGGKASILYGDLREQDVAFEQRNTAGGWVNENAPIDVPDSQVGPLDSEGRLVPFDDGRLLAVWIEFGAHDGGTRRVRHGIRPAAGGTWEPIYDTAIWIGDGASPVPTGLEAGVTDAGEAIAAWYAPDDAGARVMVARMAASTAWDEPVPFAGGLVPTAAAADGGTMASFWSQPGSLMTAGTDPGGPLGAASPFAPSPGSVMATGGRLLVAGWKGGVDAPISTITAGSAPPAPPGTGPGPQPLPPPPAPGGGDGPATLSALKATCTKPRRGGPCRIRLRFAVDKATDVTITVKRVGAKRRLGRLTRTVEPPQATLRLPARLKGKKLRPGRHRIAIAVPDGETYKRTVRVR